MSNLQERDKIILYVLAAGIILAAAYFFGYKNFSEQRDKYKAEAASLNEEYNSLIVLQKNREQYKADTVTYQEARTELLSEFQDGYSQEDVIQTLVSLEDTKDLRWTDCKPW